MSTEKKLKLSETRKKRVRYKLKQAKKLRLTVFISNRHILAQIIDDKIGHTLAAVSSLSKEFIASSTPNANKSKSCNIESAKIIGKMLAEKALAAGIKDDIVYDRGSKRFHGKIKALAEGAREGGLSF